MIKRQEIVDLARTYLGVKWQHQGRTREGIDCAGLVVVVGKELGLIDFDMTNYRRRPDKDHFVQFFAQGGGIRKRIIDAKPGDVLVMRESTYPCHSVIVSEKYDVPHIVHAHMPRRVVFEEQLIGEWLEKRVACFSFPGVAD